MLTAYAPLFISFSYRLQYSGQNMTTVYAEDVSECGRAPNYFSTSALEWFCLYHGENYNGPTFPSCTSFAICKLFGSCEPTNTTDV